MVVKKQYDPPTAGL